MLQAALTGEDLIDAAAVARVEADMSADLPTATRPASVAAVDSVPMPDDRIALLEMRIEEQDAALRRVLTLLVDWVEGDAAKPSLPHARAA